MALLLGYGADPVYEFQSGLEVDGLERFLYMVAVDDLPAGELHCQVGERLAFERRNPAPAGHALLRGEIACGFAHNVAASIIFRLRDLRTF